MKHKKRVKKTTNASRRTFLKKSSMAAAAVMAGCSPKVAEQVAETTTPPVEAPVISNTVIGANDRIVAGYVGVGGQGFNSHLRNVKSHGGAMNAVGAAACDVYSVRRDRAREELEITDNDVYEDHRALLERDDIDVVFIGTVDHWHADIAIDAMDAGKHVYCEKPMTRYLMEGFDVYDKVKETGLKFQVGSQYCTEGKWHKAAELIRAGRIGPLVLAQDSYMRNSPQGEWNYYQIEDELVAGETIDWSHWLGPVSDREFNPEHYHRWRKYYPYCAGILGDLLAHRIHPMLIATGNPEFPKRVACIGNKVIMDQQMGPEDRDVTDNTQLITEFPSGLCMLITGSSVNEQGLEQVIRGQEATLYFSGNTAELRPERPFADFVDPERYDNLEPGVNIPDHIMDLFTAIREDKEPNGNIDVAIRCQTIISMAEMSERLGLMLYFDEESRKITDKAGREIPAITYGTLDLS